MHTYIYIHIRTHTHIHIYTHTHTTCTYARTQSTSETTARQQLRGKPDLTPRSSFLLPVRCDLGGDYPSWLPAQLPVHEEQRISVEQPQPTAAHRTITTARCLDHIRLSALVRSHSTQFMAHPSCQLGHGPSKRGHFSAILAVFLNSGLTHNLLLTNPAIETPLLSDAFSKSDSNIRHQFVLANISRFSCTKQNKTNTARKETYECKACIRSVRCRAVAICCSLLLCAAVCCSML